MEYNTNQGPLILKEYGRNVQRLIKFISEHPDKEIRTRYSHLLIGLMKLINPAVKENHDNPQRIWDHLHVMSEFKLEIDGPYPAPDPESLYKRPERLPYPEHSVKFKHYGKGIERMLEKALVLEDPREKVAALAQIGRIMKMLAASYNRDNTEDATIIKHMEEITKVELASLWTDQERQSGTLFEQLPPTAPPQIPPHVKQDGGKAHHQRQQQFANANPHKKKHQGNFYQKGGKKH